MTANPEPEYSRRVMKDGNATTLRRFRFSSLEYRGRALPGTIRLAMGRMRVGASRQRRSSHAPNNIHKRGSKHMFQTLIRYSQRFAWALALAVTVAGAASSQTQVANQQQAQTIHLTAAQIEELAQKRLHEGFIVLDPRTSREDQTALKLRILQLFKQAGKSSPVDAQGVLLGVKFSTLPTPKVTPTPAPAIIHLNAAQIDALAKQRLFGKALVLDPRISREDQTALRLRILQLFKEAGKSSPTDAQGILLGVRVGRPGEKNITPIPGLNP